MKRDWLVLALGLLVIGGFATLLALGYGAAGPAPALRSTLPQELVSPEPLNAFAALIVIVGGIALMLWHQTEKRMEWNAMDGRVLIGWGVAAVLVMLGAYTVGHLTQPKHIMDPGAKPGLEALLEGTEWEGRPDAYLVHMDSLRGERLPPYGPHSRSLPERR